MNLLKRGGQRTLCEFEFAIERAETTGVYGKPPEYWQKFKEAITSSTARRVERDTRQGKTAAWEIDADTTLYRVSNEDIPDLINTIQKMAQKRALVAATLIATSASEFFTQDVEDAWRDRCGFGTLSDPGGPSRRVDAGEQKLDRNGLQEKFPVAENCASHRPWKNFGEMRRFFEDIRERVGETQYLTELEVAGVANPAQFRSPGRAMECYSRLMRIAAQQEVA